MKLPYPEPETELSTFILLLNMLTFNPHKKIILLLCQLQSYTA